MLGQVLIDPKTKDRYGRKRFIHEIQSYLAWMHENGYAAFTIAKRLFLLGSFSDFLAGRRVNTLDEAPRYVASFVHQRVQKSQQEGRTKDPGRLGKEITSLIKPFLRFLERTGVLQPPPAPPSAMGFSSQKILNDFFIFYRIDRGLAEPTLALYSFYVRRFLAFVETLGDFPCSQWSRQILYDYLKQEGLTTGRRGMHGVCSALRSLFRFLQVQGYSLIPGLDTFPRPRIYRHESLPRFLHTDQLKRVLESVDRTTKKGLRDYAILVLLIIYGMRAAEVARLTLDDLDWVADKIHLKNRKTRRSDVFPLSAPAGEAIVEYLRKARPPTGLRQLFFSLTAPIRPFRSGSPVSLVARKYLLASGIPLPDRPGAHLFRHSLAQQLLSAGTPHKTIGDFLGHFSASSTSVYLKIDLGGLTQVALNDGEDLL